MTVSPTASTTSSTTASGRMSAGERRELVLAAGLRAFARSGYAGTSTDAVAREAGVSQPYVVRIFGTKLELFLEVLDRAIGRINDAFAAIIDEQPFDPEDEAAWERLGYTYTGLITDRDLLQVMMHGFSGGNEPEIAAHARAGMGAIWTTITATGASDERAMEFIAHGMLINVMLLMRAPEHLHENPELTPMTWCTFGEELEKLDHAAPDVAR